MLNKLSHSSKVISISVGKVFEKKNVYFIKTSRTVLNEKKYEKLNVIRNCKSHLCQAWTWLI